jgi:AcrR family transcriptional regulator
LEAAALLLADSADGDISTRAVCEAAGVSAPMIYRLFGDKEGLLTAVADYGFDKFVASKRAPSDDPVQDLRDGWDAHVGFALAYPSFYRLMYSPGARVSARAATQAQRMLTEVLDRCAVAGRLRVSAQVAAQVVMAANVGTALTLINRPDIFTSLDLSQRVRDAVHADILTPVRGDPLDHAGPHRAPPDPPRAAAAQLHAILARTANTTLSEAENRLLLQWLTQLSDAPVGS